VKRKEKKKDSDQIKAIIKLEGHMAKKDAAANCTHP
jgi:hypothetical protein